MSVPTLLSLIVSSAALLVAIAALLQASRRGKEVDSLHDRIDDEFGQWRSLLTALQHKIDEAHERASQPSMPGDAALRLQGATEGIEDLRHELDALRAQVKRESEQRLSTEVSLFDALDKLKATEPAAAPAAPRRPRSSSSLFEIVEFGDESLPAEG